LASFFILFFTLFERPVESFVAIITVAVGIPVYFIFKKQNRY
jgi:hypothetical protein